MPLRRESKLARSLPWGTRIVSLMAEWHVVTIVISLTYQAFVEYDDGPAVGACQGHQMLPIK